MVAVPPPIIVTTSPEIVAIPAGLIVYDHAPELLEVGGVNVNGASPSTLAGTVNVPRVGGVSV